MREETAAYLARVRTAMLFRERCVQAALDHYRRVDLSPNAEYARAALHAMETLIREDERGRAAERVRALSAVNTEPGELAIVERAAQAVEGSESG